MNEGARQAVTSRCCGNAPWRGPAWSLASALLLNACLFSLAWCFFVPCYETNDDLTMQLIASGFYTGHPSEYLVFTSVLLGWPLKLLYSLWPCCNWYLAYLVGVHCAASAGIAFVVLERGRCWSALTAYVGFFLLVELRILVNLQFTTTAFLAGTAGVLLLVNGLQQDRQRTFSPRALCGVLLIALMITIRVQVAPLLCLIALPFLVRCLRGVPWRRLVALGASVLGLCGVLVEIDRRHYQSDPAWADYIEYNALRGKMHVTALTAFVPEAAYTAGWTRNDGRMFADFYFSEPEVFGNVARLRSLYAGLKSVSLPVHFIYDLSPQDFWLPKVFGGDAGLLMWFGILYVAILLTWSRGENRSWCWTVLATYVLLVALSLYLRGTSRLPERVSYNMASFLNAICLYWLVDALAKRTTPRPRTSSLKAKLVVPWVRVGSGIAVVGLLVGCVVLGGKLGRSVLTASSAHRELRRISAGIGDPIKKLLPDARNPILVPMPFDSVLEQCLFFQGPSASAGFSLLPYGWLSHSPLFREVLDLHGLRPYSRSLLDREEVFFLMETRWIGPLRTFYAEHYGENVTFVEVLNTDHVPGQEGYQLHLYRPRRELSDHRVSSFNGRSGGHANPNDLVLPGGP
jgi:hypothetical protein